MVIVQVRALTAQVAADDAEEARLDAQAQQLDAEAAAALKAADDLDDEIGEIVSNWAEETGRTKTYLHTFFY